MNYPCLSRWYTRTTASRRQAPIGPRPTLDTLKLEWAPGTTERNVSVACHINEECRHQPLLFYHAAACASSRWRPSVVSRGAPRGAQRRLANEHSRSWCWTIQAGNAARCVTRMVRNISDNFLRGYVHDHCARSSTFNDN